MSEEQTRARGIHVAVLNQATGEAMAVRVFDTYLPGNEETLVSFLDSVMDERILCFVIAVSVRGRGAPQQCGSATVPGGSTSAVW